MQDKTSTNQEMGLPFYDPRGERYPRLDDPTAPYIQQGVTPLGQTDVLPARGGPLSSVSARAGENITGDPGRGTIDANMSETTSSIESDCGGAASTLGFKPRHNAGRKPLLRMATLNVRGLGGRARSERSKPMNLVRWMRASRIGILAVQETYAALTPFANMEKSNAKIWAFPNPGDRHSAGTGFILHTEGLPPGVSKDDFEHKIVIEGRCDTLSFKWGEGNLKIANVYAPNDPRVAVDFFDNVVNKLKSEKVDLIMGDWNHVEAKMDRLPKRAEPPTGISTAFKNLRRTLKVYDAWRENDPTGHEYTWESSTPNADGSFSKSRLDRIYMTEDMDHRLLNQQVDDALTISNHAPVTAEFYNDEAPERGPCRWKMNLEDLEDEVLTEECRKALLKCQTATGTDPMGSWLRTKKAVQNATRNRQTSRRRERSELLRKYKEKRVALAHRKDYAQNIGLQKESDVLRERIASIERRKLDRAAESASARYSDKGEAVNKYWFNIGKSLGESSAIRALKDEAGQLSTETADMADIAKRHHERLQTEQPMDEPRKQAIQRMTDLLSDKTASPDAEEGLSRVHTPQDVRNAIIRAQSGKAAGKDGIPYEFYKYWVTRWDNKDPDGPPIPNICKILADVWNTVPQGRPPPKEYTEGLMFLLYKKKERDNVANYRPITLLNCDYKLQTKDLATRLGKFAPSMLHPDQAGFVPGRDILDHVKLAQLVKTHCDTTEINGCLVALDQEKAYDRIDHAYLWEVLRAYGLPRTFTNTVKALYANATTRCLLNDMESDPFAVKRGVRQGDPLSCLLFDLAIEPLAEALRRSTLKGIRIPGAVERLVVRLFADDTQLYLSKKDKWSEAKGIMDTWCLASTARFNEGKTEFLPMGSQAYRERFGENKSIKDPNPPQEERLPHTARFISDKEPLRILGGHVGHKIDQEKIWETATAGIEDLATKWSKRRMTLKGRKLITSFIIQSRAQYLLRTNDPPTAIVKRILKATHRVMWAGRKRGLTTMKVLQKPIKKGGQGVPNFESKLQTSRLMWAKKWCAPDDGKPLWANVLDEILKTGAKEKAQVEVSSTLTQTLKTKKGARSTVPKDVQNMLREADRFNLRTEALKISRETKAKIPAWLSKMTNLTPKNERQAGMKHLREFHRVTTMGDLDRVTPQNTESCRKHVKCMALKDEIMRATHPRFNLRLQTPLLGDGKPDDLDFTDRRKRRQHKDRKMGNPILINPDVTLRGDIREATRIFEASADPGLLPTLRQPRRQSRREPIEVYTDGSTTGAGTVSMKCGAGVWSTEEHLNACFPVTGDQATNNAAELAAVLWVLQNAPQDRALTILTDSQYVVDGLTTTYTQWEDLGWREVENATLWQATLYEMRTRNAETRVQKVRAHIGIFGNEKADEAAKLGSTGFATTTFPETEVPVEWKLQGARLQALSFSEMYKWVEYTKSTPLQTKAPATMARVLEHLAEKYAIKATETQIWRALKARAIRKEVQDFLWVALHGRTPCGTMFSKWGEGWEDLQYCGCGAVESIKHILTQCDDARWRRTLWREASALLQKSRLLPASMMGEPNFEDILSTGMVRPKNRPGAFLRARVITETAFTIWKLRNRARFDEIEIPTRMALNVWNDAIERQAKIDLNISRMTKGRTALDLKRAHDIATAWGSLASLSRGVLTWNFADHG